MQTCSILVGIWNDLYPFDLLVIVIPAMVQSDLFRNKNDSGSGGETERVRESGVTNSLGWFWGGLGVRGRELEVGVGEVAATMVGIHLRTF